MTDTAPKTLVEEMADAFWDKIDEYRPVVDRNASIESMQAAARVLLERMRIQKKTELESPDFRQGGFYADVEWFEAFARKHGLSAEDER